MDNKLQSILFVAYFFPPAEGVALPAVQRVKRLLRYLNVGRKYVLTLKENQYPEYVLIGKQREDKENHEIIYRTGSLDLMKILNRLINLAKNILKTRRDSTDTTTVNDRSKNKKNRFHKRRIVEYISILLSYPDFARPWIFHAIFRGIILVKKHKIRIVYATGMPWTSLLIGFVIKKMTGVRLIVDFRDPWVGNPYIEKTGFEEYLDRTVELHIVHKADIIIANTHPLEKEMRDRYPDINNKLITVPNGYDVNDFRDLPEIELPSEKLIISHAGFLYLKRDPITILRALENLKKEHPTVSTKVQFHQIGNVRLNYDLDEYCQNNGIADNVVLKDQLKHKECLGYLAASDVLLLIQPETRTQVPSKFYEYIYLEKPILAITEKKGALGQIMIQNNIGRVFEPDEGEKISEYLYEIVNRKMKNENIAVKKYQEALFDVKQIISRLEKRIKSQLSKPMYK